MKVINNLLWLAAGILAGVAVYHYLEKQNVPKVHKLEAPLMLAGGHENNATTLLPRGTSMYFDQSFPEGFTRYIVYVNVEGVQLELKEANDKFWLDPLSAWPVDKPTLQELLKKYPLSKEDLSAILGSGSLSKEEIRDLLREYSQ